MPIFMIGNSLIVLIMKDVMIILVIMMLHLILMLCSHSSAFVHGRSRPRRNYATSHAPRKVYNGPTTVYHACNAYFILLCKNAKVVARKLGSKCKGDKTCLWVPKTIVTNLAGPNKSLVPKT
jgi:hypothetical protein